MNELDKELYEMFWDKTISKWCVIIDDKHKDGRWIDYPYTIIRFIEHLSPSLKTDTICTSDMRMWFCSLSDIYDNVLTEKDPSLCTEKRINQNFTVIWYEPTIVDIFQKFKEQFKDMNSVLTITSRDDENWFVYYIWWKYYTFWTIPYEPTISLLKQSDDTKNALISMFKTYI